MGEFFELHPGGACDAAQDPRNDLTQPASLCVIPWFTPPKGLRIAPTRPPKAAQARAGWRLRRARAAKVPSLQGVGAGDPPPETEQALLRRFARHEVLGAAGSPEKRLLPAGATRVLARKSWGRPERVKWRLRACKCVYGQGA